MQSRGKSSRAAYTWKRVDLPGVLCVLMFAPLSVLSISKAKFLLEVSSNSAKSLSMIVCAQFSDKR